MKREFEQNARTSPELYIDVAMVTKDTDGRLALNGPGLPVEAVLRMHRFDQAALLSAMARFF